MNTYINRHSQTYFACKYFLLYYCKTIAHFGIILFTKVKNAERRMVALYGSYLLILLLVKLTGHLLY